MSKVWDKLKCETWNIFIPNYAYGWWRYGEIGIVKHSGITKKTENSGFVCSMIGYGDDHSSGVYRMMNIDTKRVSVKRDIKWMNMNYKKYKNLEEDKKSEESESSIKETNISNSTSNNKENEQESSEGKHLTSDSE